MVVEHGEVKVVDGFNQAEGVAEGEKKGGRVAEGERKRERGGRGVAEGVCVGGGGGGRHSGYRGTGKHEQDAYPWPEAYSLHARLLEQLCVL